MAYQGVNQNKNILQRVNQKKYFTEEKTRNDLYYRGKDLLTQFKKMRGGVFVFKLQPCTPSDLKCKKLFIF